MRITTRVENVQILSINEVPSKDGTKTYYQMAIFTDEKQAGMIPTCEEVSLSGVKPGSFGDLICEYNDQYDSFRCVSVKVAGK